MSTAAASQLGRAARAGFGLRPLLLFLIRSYRTVVSPAIPRSCRFQPSCAAYAEESLRRHPLPRAIWLTIRRILRCHPFHPGGYDPVP